jgi:hypothetical protein
MKPECSSKKPQASWKELYIAALYENDRSRLPHRIGEAQAAIEAERKKLFFPERELCRDLCDVTQERQALDNALFSLHSLATCMAVPGAAAESPL